MKKFYFSLIAGLMALTFVQAQRTVSGKITDEAGESLPGVNVLIKGTTTGTQTDLDGNYRLQVEDGAVLVYSYVGFETQEIEVGSRTTIDISLGGATELQEVVVTGYGPNQSKERSNISVAKVDAKTIQNRPNASLAQRLQGQVAGLNISTPTGQPGANSIIRIRGVSSINGDTEPLFIIDGTPVDQDNFRSLNPNNIANVSVLKDAGATAIYGNRGANGVIVIETKSGSYKQPMQIDYTYLGGISRLPRDRYNLMNSQEQLFLERDARLGIGGTRLQSSNFDIPDQYPDWIDPNRPDNTFLTDEEILSAPNTDWLDVFFRDAVSHNHNLSLTTGGEQSNVFLSFNYLNQEGILRNSALERYSLRANINGVSGNEKLTYSLRTTLNYSKNDEPGGIDGNGINRNPVLGALQSVPYVSTSDYTNGADLTNSVLFRNTPLYIFDNLRTLTEQDDEIRIITSLDLGYQITDDLSISYRVGGDFQDENFMRAEGPESFNALLFAEDGNETPGFQEHRNTKEFALNQVASLNYQKSFDEHTISAGLYTEWAQAWFNRFGFLNEGLDPKTFDPGDGSAFVDDNAENDFFVDDIQANLLETGLFSYFGSIGYDYAGRYNINGVLRRDYSTRFAEGNRLGTFGSVSASWNIHNEAFFNAGAINLLKIRASYGTNGNQIVAGSDAFSSPDEYLNRYVTAQGYGGANALILGSINDENLTWETVTTSNLGVDLEAFNGRLDVTLEGYVRTTTDLFLETPISSVNGFSIIRTNIGEMENRGIDWEVRYNILQANTNDEVNLSFSFVGNYNQNTLIDLPTQDGTIQNGGLNNGREGGKLGEYFVVRYAGVNPANGNLLFLTADNELTENPNPDTDRVWVGQNVLPDFDGSFGLDFSYKGFFANVQFNYVIGVDRFDNDYAGFMNPNNIGQFRSSADLTRAWTPQNTNTDVPALNATNLAITNGTRFLVSADYLRLRFAQIGYQIPTSIVERANLRNARVYINGENLATISGWRGLDPEAQVNTANDYPTPAVISVGIDIGF